MIDILRSYPELLDLRRSLKAMLALFDDEGNMTATFEELQNAVNGGFDSLTRTAPSYEIVLPEKPVSKTVLSKSEMRKLVRGGIPARQAIALEIWHRFADSSIEEWEDETHKAEYLLCADAILSKLTPANPTEDVGEAR